MAQQTICAGPTEQQGRRMQLTGKIESDARRLIAKSDPPVRVSEAVKEEKE
jgi:hypothetical protein